MWIYAFDDAKCKIHIFTVTTSLVNLPCGIHVGWHVLDDIAAISSGYLDDLEGYVMLD
jgi:hypothetical protein